MCERTAVCDSCPSACLLSTKTAFRSYSRSPIQLFAYINPFCSHKCSFIQFFTHTTTHSCRRSFMNFLFFFLLKKNQSSIQISISIENCSLFAVRRVAIVRTRIMHEQYGVHVLYNTYRGGIRGSQNETSDHPIPGFLIFSFFFLLLPEFPLDTVFTFWYVLAICRGGRGGRHDMIQIPDQKWCGRF